MSKERREQLELQQLELQNKAAKIDLQFKKALLQLDVEEKREKLKFTVVKRKTVAAACIFSGLTLLTTALGLTLKLHTFFK